MIDSTLGIEVEMTAPNGSPINAVLDKGECAYYATFALVETPEGAYTVERDIAETQFSFEGAKPSTRHGHRLYRAEDGSSYTLDQLTITDAHGTRKQVTPMPILASENETEHLRRRVQDALQAAGNPDIDTRAFALGTYLAEGLPREQALALANATRRENDTIQIDIRDTNIPWPQPHNLNT